MTLYWQMQIACGKRIHLTFHSGQVRVICVCVCVCSNVHKYQILVHLLTLFITDCKLVVYFVQLLPSIHICIQLHLLLHPYTWPYPAACKPINKLLATNAKLQWQQQIIFMCTCGQYVAAGNTSQIYDSSALALCIIQTKASVRVNDFA